jgi:hypothetical protein
MGAERSLKAFPLLLRHSDPGQRQPLAPYQIALEIAIGLFGKGGDGMTKALNIVMVASEVAPFAKTGGLADVTGPCPRRW